MFISRYLILKKYLKEFLLIYNKLNFNEFLYFEKV